jgi:hypothetical protein
MPPAPVRSDQMFTACDKTSIFSIVCTSYCRTHLTVNLKHACTENLWMPLHVEVQSPPQHFGYTEICQIFGT